MPPAVLLLAIWACLGTTVSSTNPGLQIRFAQQGIDTAARLIIDQLAGEVRSLRFPDSNGRSGSFKYWVSSISVRGFTKPTSRVTMTPASGITWAASGAGMSIRGNWRYEKKLWFIKVRDSGSFEMSGSAISFRVSVKMGMNSQGRPTIYTTGCTSRIGSLSVRIRGSWLSWLYNLFRGTIARRIRTPAERAMCTSAKKAVNTDLNKQLSELKVVNTINNKFVFDYRLVRAPIFGTGFVQTMQKGEVRTRVNPQPFSASPAAFPPPSGPAKMVYIWGSDYVINSFASSAFRLGLIKYSYSSKDLQANDRGFLQTTCSGSTICLGTLFPGVATMFPNRQVTLLLRAERAPYISIRPAGVNLTLPGLVTVNATSETGQSDTILRIRLNVNASINVRLDNNLVKGRVTALSPEFTVLESVIPDITSSNLQVIYDRLIKEFLEEKLDELGGKGIEVPDLKQIKFIRPTVKFSQGSVMFGTDLDWRTLVPPRVIPTRRPPRTLRPPVPGRPGRPGRPGEAIPLAAE